MKCNQSHPRFELMSLCPFLATITITLRAPPFIFFPLHSSRIWHKINLFKQSLTDLNSEFYFSLTSCLTKAEEPSLPYYLPITGGKIIGFIPFPRVLVLCEMQSVSFRIWTCIVESISYDDNQYTTGMEFIFYGFIQSPEDLECTDCIFCREVRPTHPISIWLWH